MMSRRGLIGLGVGVGVAGVASGIVVPGLIDTKAPVGPNSRLVAATEAARTHTGSVVRRRLRAAPTSIDLGGRVVSSWAYDDSVPGREIRVRAGDRLRVELANGLPESTSIHWHGLALRNDMDGVPGLTQPSVSAGEAFVYDFVVPDPGTYFFHPHFGVQLDTGLSAPLIVEDPAEPGTYDQEVAVVLDDWTDGWAATPNDILSDLSREGMGGMDMGMDGTPSPEEPLGADTGDVEYPAHVMNGRVPQSPETIQAKPGQRIRFRIINAGSDTAYRFAVAEHRLTVTHTDGFPVAPVQADCLILGMGERYDVVVEAGDGVFAVVAAPEGKQGPAARALLRTGSGDAPALDLRPAELDGRLLTYRDLTADASVAFDDRPPDRELDLLLEMGDGGRRWLINKNAYGDHEPLVVEAGERVRMRMRNESMMFHPMHLHGHTFALDNGSGTGPRKDTVNVLPMQELTVDIQTDNPGQWLTHCHNVYHGELGMLTVLSYVV